MNGLTPINTTVRFRRKSRSIIRPSLNEPEIVRSSGVTIFRGIHAVDGDKPNTPNSDVRYAIVKGNEEGKFSLESGHRTALILRKPVDYSNGDREFTLVIAATVSTRCDISAANTPLVENRIIRGESFPVPISPE